MSRQMKVALNLLTVASDPSNATAGDVYFNILSKNLRIYNTFGELGMKDSFVYSTINKCKNKENINIFPYLVI